MAPVRPMLDDLELQQVQQIEVDGDQVLAQHAIPGLEGDFFQGLGRRATQVTLSGVLTNNPTTDAVGESLKALRNKFRAAQPVSFVADIATATKVDEVLIEEMGVREIAGHPARFEYGFTLREYVEATDPGREIPPPPPPPPPVVQTETGTLVVKVIVESQPNFDHSNTVVSVQGTQEDGEFLSRTLTNRSDNVWTEEEFPVGSYTVTASVTEPEPLSGSKPATVAANATECVTIRLTPGQPIAKAFIIHYWFDKAFVEPCMRMVLRQVAEFAQTHAKDKFLIVGHTDESGSATYNQSLSERRARAAYAYLTFGHDPDAAVSEWNELRRQRQTGVTQTIHDSWGPRQYQQMLQDLGYYPGNISDNGADSTEALRTFQADNGLTPDGIIGDQSWPVLIRAYMAQDALAVPFDRFLLNAKGECDGGTLKWLGCGESDPAASMLQQCSSPAWRPNRRTELLFVNDSEIPCEVPEPVTFNLPSPGAVSPRWCLGPGDPNDRCCFLTRDPNEKDKWLVQPAKPGSITVSGSIKFEDGTPLANTKYVLIAPDGEFMDGEQVCTPTKGIPIPGKTDANGGFSYTKQTGIGIYTMEILAPVVARAEGEPASDAKGNIVCKRLDQGDPEFKVVVMAVNQLPDGRRLTGVIHDEYRQVRPNIEVQLLFGDGSNQMATTDLEGRFTVNLDFAYQTARISYPLSDDIEDAVQFEEFFIDVKSISSDEGVLRRLHNLGYDVTDLRLALLAFQTTHGLDTTGEADVGTRAQLSSVHDGSAPIVPNFTVAEAAVPQSEIRLT